MKPFAYHQPSEIPDAAKLLTSIEDSKLVAGGMTLIPTLKQRLALARRPTAQPTPTPSNACYTTPTHPHPSGSPARGSEAPLPTPHPVNSY